MSRRDVWFTVTAFERNRWKFDFFKQLTFETIFFNHVESMVMILTQTWFLINLERVFFQSGNWSILKILILYSFLSNELRILSIKRKKTYTSGTWIRNIGDKKKLLKFKLSIPHWCLKSIGFIMKDLNRVQIKRRTELILFV